MKEKLQDAAKDHMWSANLSVLNKAHRTTEEHSITVQYVPIHTKKPPWKNPL